MVAEELETAEFDWSFDNTSQLINLYETFPCLYHRRSKDRKNRDTRDKALVEIAAKLEVSEFPKQSVVCSEYGSIS